MIWKLEVSIQHHANYINYGSLEIYSYFIIAIFLVLLLLVYKLNEESRWVTVRTEEYVHFPVEVYMFSIFYSF
jgi:hypothetical protein